MFASELKNKTDDKKKVLWVTREIQKEKLNDGENEEKDNSTVRSVFLREDRRREV